MSDGLTIDALIDLLAERVAAKVRAEFTQAGNGGAGAGVKPRLLTIEQTAVYLGRSREAVRHMVNSGKIPSVRGDRCIALDREDLDRWIEENKRTGLPA